MPWRVLFLLALALSAPAAALAADIPHVARSGDHPAFLARVYHVPLAAILERNKGLDPCRIKVGDVILVPAPSEARPDAPAPPPKAGAGGVPDEDVPGVRYVVVPGDAPAAIAERFGIPLDALNRSNPGLDPRKMAVGRVLTIPEAGACAPPPVPVARPGETSGVVPLVMDFQ